METKEKIQLTAGIFILLAAVGTTYYSRRRRCFFLRGHKSRGIVQKR